MPDGATGGQSDQRSNQRGRPRRAQGGSNFSQRTLARHLHICRWQAEGDRPRTRAAKTGWRSSQEDTKEEIRRAKDGEPEFRAQLRPVDTSADCPKPTFAGLALVDDQIKTRRSVIAQYGADQRVGLAAM